MPHHSKDARPVCDPQGVPAIQCGLINAPVKKLVMLGGGKNPSVYVCEALTGMGTSEWSEGIIGDGINASTN